MQRRTLADNRVGFHSCHLPGARRLPAHRGRQDHVRHGFGACTPASPPSTGQSAGPGNTARHRARGRHGESRAPRCLRCTPALAEPVAGHRRWAHGRCTQRLARNTHAALCSALVDGAQMRKRVGFRALAAMRTQCLCKLLRRAVPARGDADPAVPETRACEVIAWSTYSKACGLIEDNLDTARRRHAHRAPAFIRHRNAWLLHRNRHQLLTVRFIPGGQ